MLLTAALTTTACSSTTAGHPHPPLAPATPPAAITPASPVTSAPSTPPAIPDPCTLLTRAQAETLAGVPLGPGDDARAQSVSDIASCNYTAPSTGSSGSVQIYVQAGQPNALGIDMAIHHTFRTITGIGDQTLEEPDNNSIFIRKGQLWVYLNIPYGASPKAMERAARIIAARLP